MTQTSLSSLSDDALDQLFLQARTVHAFTPVPVSDETIQKLYDLMKWGPTAFNAPPARFVFVRSPQAKAKLLAALTPGNVAQTTSAAVTVLIAQDLQFFQHLPEQFPAYDAKPLFEGNASLAQATAFRNSSLQGAYLILAARALGLDAGPQSGFNPQLVNEEFFPDGRYQVNFIVNLGVADPAGIYPRGPRLAFDTVAKII